MAWSGGVFSRALGPNQWATDAAANVGIEAGIHDTQDNDLATGINNCINKNGANTPTANMSHGGFRLTSLGSATLDTDAATFAQTKRLTCLHSWMIPVTVGAQANVSMAISNGDGIANADTVPLIFPTSGKITHISLVVAGAASFSAAVEVKSFLGGVDQGANSKATLPLATNNGAYTLVTPVVVAANSSFNLRVNHSGVAVGANLFAFAWGWLDY